jgi:hypothetical protein
VNNPTPPEIEHDPELAILAVLDAVLETTANALVAAHLELCDLQFDRRPTSRPTEIADAILRQVRPLRANLARYQTAVDDQRRAAADRNSDANPF